MDDKEYLTGEERMKTLEEQVAFLQDKVLEQSNQIGILALYIANTPCCTPDKYAQLTGGVGAIGIAEPQFIRELRRNANGICC